MPILETGAIHIPGAGPTLRLTAETVRSIGYSMPIHSPSFTNSPVWLRDRPALTITYRTDPERIRAIVPEPLEIDDPLVSLTFLHMAGQGIGDYYEFAQSISCSYEGERLSFRPLMIAENVTAIISGREILGLPKKHGYPLLEQKGNSFVGTLRMDDILVAQASMTYKYAEWDIDAAEAALNIPGVVLKIIPDEIGNVRSAELIKISYSDLTVKEAWSGPGSVNLFANHLAPLADLPVKEIVAVRHTVCDCKLLPGQLLFDYFA